MSQDSTREHEHEVNHGHDHDGDDHDGHLKIDVTVRTPAGISLEFDVRQTSSTQMSSRPASDTSADAASWRLGITGSRWSAAARRP